MTSAEAMRPRGDTSPLMEGGAYKPPLFEPTSIPHIPFKEERPEQPREYKYEFQQRIATEWAHLLGDDFTPAINLDVFKQKRDQLYQLSTVPNMVSKVDLTRKKAYLKIAAVSLATSYKIDIFETVEKKLMEKMQTKYPPSAFTELRLLGYTVDEARRYLKSLSERGQSYQLQGITIPPEEQEARMHRKPSFPDLFQDMGDTWQRAAMGSDLEKADRMDIVFGETDELIEEFEGPEEIDANSITDAERLRDISGEIADVMISIDGDFSSNDMDVKRWQDFALDRMVDTYGDLPKLRRLGVPTQDAMRYLSECRYRDDNGYQRPISPVAGYFGPIFRITFKEPLEPNYASDRIH